MSPTIETVAVPSFPLVESAAAVVSPVFPLITPVVLSPVVSAVAHPVAPFRPPVDLPFVFPTAAVHPVVPLITPVVSPPILSTAVPPSIISPTFLLLLLQVVFYLHHTAHRRHRRRLWPSRITLRRSCPRQHEWGGSEGVRGGEIWRGGCVRRGRE